MPKISDDYRSSQRAKIVDSAIRAFGRKGFQGTSMSDIIAESGMSSGAIYAYFPGKADIIAEAASRVLGGRILAIEQISMSETLPTPGELVKRVLTGIREELGNPSIVVQVWAEGVSDPQLRTLTNNAFGGLLNAFRRYLAAWHRLEHGLTTDGAEALALEEAPLLLSACQGYLAQYALLDGFDSEFYLTHVVKHLPH